MRRSASLSSNQLYNLDYLQFEFYHVPVNVWFALHVYIRVPQAWIVLTLSRHVNGTHSLLLGQEKHSLLHILCFAWLDLCIPYLCTCMPSAMISFSTICTDHACIPLSFFVDEGHATYRASQGCAQLPDQTNLHQKQLHIPGI